MAVTPEEQKNARRKAMLLLEHMDRTEKGLSDRLRQAGFSAEATEDAMNYVRSYGYLNDYPESARKGLSREASSV